MAKIKNLSVDLECYSSADLTKTGVYKYAESPDFEILLFGYAVDGGEVRVVDLAAGENIPDKILTALTDDSVIKWAFNASFERICLSRWLGYETGEYLNPSSWRCSLVWSAYMGLPLSLENVGTVLGLEQQKMREGKDLIRYFCKPCRPTKKNGGRTRNLYYHDDEKWELFKEYNKRDVETEMGIQNRLRNYPVPDNVWNEYHLSEEINDRGIGVDTHFVSQAIRCDEKSSADLRLALQNLTSLQNPNSVIQMKDWLSKHGLEAESLDKKAVISLLKDCPEDIRDVLTVRQQLSKSSVRKYTAMQNAVCSDSRVRGMFQFYGANRTGRFAGRLVQLQNLPQNHIEDLAEARETIYKYGYDEARRKYDSVPDILSELIRTAFIPQYGRKFIVADFSAIEARVIAWYAGEEWRNELFANGGDIYCQSASQMFHVPVEKNGVNGHLRQKGKIAELACIAEDSLVLTNRGLIPIQKVAADDKVWDGENWVRHEGVVYKGEREVITYEGLTATPDHFVWVDGESRPIQFGAAAAGGAHLIKAGNGGTAVRLGEDYFSGKKMEREKKSLLCADRVYRLWRGAVDYFRRVNLRKIKGLSGLFSTEENTEVAGKATDSSKAAMRKSKEQGIQKLRRKRYPILVCECVRSRVVSDRTLWPASERVRDRSNRHKRQLCSGKFKIYYTFTKPCQSAKVCFITFFSRILALFTVGCNTKTYSGLEQGGNHQGCRKGSGTETKKLEANKRKVRVYDIRNAGENHRFTVSDCLVHNCGYGGSVGALKAMGAVEMGLTEEELQPLVNAWRQSNPNIVRFWWDVDSAAKTAIKKKTVTETHGIRFTCKSGMLFITLPSGRNLAYVKPRIGENCFGGESITYEGVGMTKRWERLESYGPKLVENIVQATARDILLYSMETLKNCSIVAHVHDELIIEADRKVSLEAVCEQMGRTPPWVKGLLLRADGYECEFYKKD